MKTHTVSAHAAVRPPPRSLQAVEDMCMHQMQARLYARLQAECDAHIGTQLDALQGHMRLPPTAFLEQVGVGVSVCVWGGGAGVTLPPQPCALLATCLGAFPAAAAAAAAERAVTTAVQHGLLIQGSNGYDSEAAHQ